MRFSIALFILFCFSGTKKYYNYHDFNKGNSTYSIIPGHAGWGTYRDSAIVFLSFQDLIPGGCITRREGLKLTIDKQQVMYLDTTGDYPVKIKKGFHSLAIEASGTMYPVKTKQFYFENGGNYNLIFYLVSAVNDPAMTGRPRDPNMKHK